MNITKEIWKEIDVVLAKYQIPYTTYFEKRNVQRVMKEPDVAVRDKHYKIHVVIPDYFEDATITTNDDFEEKLKNKFAREVAKLAL